MNVMLTLARLAAPPSAFTSNASLLILSSGIRTFFLPFLNSVSPMRLAHGMLASRETCTPTAPPVGTNRVLEQWAEVEAFVPHVGRRADGVRDCVGM